MGGGGQMGGRGVWLQKGNAGDTSGDGTVLYLDHGGRYMNLYMIKLQN